PGEDCDIIGLARSKARACVFVQPVRDGRLLHDRKFILDNRLEENPDSEVLAAFIKLHYANPQNIPPEIVLPAEPEDRALLEAWLGQLRAGTVEEGVGPAAGRSTRASAPGEQDRPAAGSTEPVVLTATPRAIYKR